MAQPGNVGFLGQIVNMAGRFFQGAETGVGRVASVVSSTFVELWYSRSTQERECFFSLVGL